MFSVYVQFLMRCGIEVYVGEEVGVCQVGGDFEIQFAAGENNLLESGKETFLKNNDFIWLFQKVFITIRKS